MWELLQKLEKLGWKPYGKNIAELTETEKNVRLLTSGSSGLWQFVCKNGITEKKIEYWEKFTGTQMLRYTDDYVGSMYQYYLIESALKDESELEQFLLNNIKIDDK